MIAVTRIFTITLIVSIFFIINCRDNKPKPPMLSNIDLRRGDIIMCSGKKFGEVSFSLSCKYSVRETFDLAVSLLHSFEYDEAEKAFVKVIDADPECAMAYWGVAMSIYHSLWEPPGADELKKGANILKIAESIPKTEREKEYLDAIGLYFTDWEKIDARTRASKFTKKMEDVYEKHKDDTEAAIFYALALNASADPMDKNYTNQWKAGSILEPIFVEQPNHPGVAHYIIHSYDNPVLAEKALSTARKYAEIAPGSAHAQHMPSHIFTRLGLWDESISSNLNSVASAVCYAQEAGFQAHWDEELHGMDYLVYAYLQKGDNKKAMEQNEYLNTIKDVYPLNFKDAYAISAIPARIALENKNWEKAANLELSTIEFPWETFPWQKSILHFARALGASHIGDISKAENEIAILELLHENLIKADNQYQANQVMIQLKTSKAWLNFAQGKNDEAISLMSEAANMEDNTAKHPVTPCEIIPARELLGDLLLALNKPAEALKVYEIDLQYHPQRFNGIYGAATASRMNGNQKAAKAYFERLVKQTESVNTDRPEIREAKEFLNTH